VRVGHPESSINSQRLVLKAWASLEELITASGGKLMLMYLLSARNNSTAYVKGHMASHVISIIGRAAWRRL